MGSASHCITVAHSPVLSSFRTELDPRTSKKAVRLNEIWMLDDKAIPKIWGAARAPRLTHSCGVAAMHALPEFSPKSNRSLKKSSPDAWFAMRSLSCIGSDVFGACVPELTPRHRFWVGSELKQR